MKPTSRIRSTLAGFFCLLLSGCLFLGGCSSTNTITPAQQQQVVSAAVTVASAAAVNAIQQYDTTGKVNSAQVGAAAAQAALPLIKAPAAPSTGPPAAP